MVQVESSNVATVDWDYRGDCHLIVEFKNGGRYDYGEVSGDTAARIVFAPSVGKAINSSLGKGRKVEAAS